MRVGSKTTAVPASASLLRDTTNVYVRTIKDSARANGAIAGSSQV